MTTYPTEKQDFNTPPPSYMEKSEQSSSSSAYASTLDFKPSTQKLQIKYRDIRGRHGKLTDLATGELVYTSEHRYRKPTFTLNSASGDRKIATANSHKLTNALDMSIAGNDFKLTLKHKLGTDCSYVSPTFGGRTLRWDKSSTWTGRITFVCSDDNGQPIARFMTQSSWKCISIGGFGEVEFMDGRIESEAQRDEIVATGLTLTYRAVMNQQASATVVVT